jgi:GAF domain-containing protein
LTCRAILDGTILHVRDMDAEPGVSPEVRALGFKTQVSIPLMRDGRAIGAISTSSPRVDSVSDTQIELLKTFAEQAVIAITSAETWRELQARTRDLEESLEYQTATSDVLNVISRSTADVQPVLDTVAETALRLCGADLASITIRRGEVYRHVSHSGFDAEYWDALCQRMVVPGRDSMASRVLLERGVVHVSDIRADPDHARPEAVRAGVRTSLGVPLLREGAVLGTISLGRKRVEAFTERQIELVRTFADQAVIAIENARLLGELQARTRDLEESLEYQTATSDVLNVISRSTADVQLVLDTVVETAARLCGADYAVISVREGEVYRFVASSISAAEPEYWAALRQRRIVPGRNSVHARVALEGTVVHVADIRAIPEYAQPETVAFGLRTLLGVPLLREGAVLGTIGLGRKRVEPYTERQIELVRTFADQAVIAIENARLFGELQARTRDLEESLEYQTATSDVLNVISRSTSDVQPVLDTVIETAAQLCGAGMSTILVRSGDCYRVAATFSHDREFVQTLRAMTFAPGRGSIAGRVALERQPVHIADLAADPEFAVPGAVTIGKARTALGVPLMREGEPTGVLIVLRQRVEP